MVCVCVCVLKRRDGNNKRVVFETLRNKTPNSLERSHQMVALGFHVLALLPSNKNFDLYEKRTKAKRERYLLTTRA